MHKFRSNELWNLLEALALLWRQDPKVVTTLYTLGELLSFVHGDILRFQTHVSADQFTSTISLRADFAVTIMQSIAEHASIRDRLSFLLDMMEPALILYDTPATHALCAHLKKSPSLDGVPAHIFVLPEALNW